MSAGLTFADALRIARGCTDYGGGYRYDAQAYEAYQGGIATVINALQAAETRGLADTQIRALHCMGAGVVTQAQLDKVARVLADRSADFGGVDHDDNWRLYGNDFTKDAIACAEAFGLHLPKEVANGPL